MRYSRSHSGLWLPTMMPILSMAGNAAQVGSADNALRVRGNARVVAGGGDPCCCNPNPCISCAGSQPSAAVTIAGSCDTACLIGGTFTWLNFTSGSPTCQWQWTGTFEDFFETYLTVSFNQTTNQWTGQLNIGGGDALFGTGNDAVTGLSCISGLIVASFMLPGRNLGIASNCSGCTASITI
jgi:hypothetical protein